MSFMGNNKIIIGVDFDNTIADYDQMMHGLALKQRLITAAINADKQKVRDHIRSLDNGEIKWQELQAMAYGKFMHQARLIEGVQEFFEVWRQQGKSVFIVSHKTRFAAQDKEKIDLHQAALHWVKEKRLAIRESEIFFEADRQQKINRIAMLGCTHFIDDLEEIFSDKTFPEGIEKILYAPHRPGKNSQGVLVKSSWKAIHDSFFTDI